MRDFEAEFREIAAGDENAYEFCRAVFEWVHVFDDLIDRDKPVETEAAVLTHLKLFAVLAQNPFFQHFRADLLQALQTAALAFAASERLNNAPDIQDKLAAQVLKSQYQDVFFRVAFLVGGTKHAMEMDKKHRGYSFG